MIHIATFRYNIYYENTYIAYDDTKECVIIDPGCYTNDEKQVIISYVNYQNLTPVMVLNTHCHIDHIFGNDEFMNRYKVPLGLHEKEVKCFESMPRFAKGLGFDIQPSLKNYILLQEGSSISFGDSSLDVLHTPGHTPGSISFFSARESFLLSGDVIFRNRIGKTDLPGGNYEVLTNTIKHRIFNLPENVRLYPGHGPITTVKDEKKTNPFIPGIF